ncbi:MAG TPA: MATE family efflux transporter [Anaerovoracaceae bacterium]|nr:MATE family efflux transporter [Anaerovoracaceae bacterium]
MQKQGRIINPEDKKLYKNLAAIAIPIAIQGVISSTLGLVDNLMVGFLGETELAAVGVATQIFFIHYLLLFGFSGGTATFMAQFFGAKDMKNIRKTLGFTIAIALGVGLLFFIATFFFTEQVARIYSDEESVIELACQYIKIGSPTVFFLAFSAPIEMALKTTQQTKIPLKISIAVFGTNTFLNYVFIFGKFGAPALGVAGAALATTIARCLEIGLVDYVIFRRKNILAGKFKEYIGWDKEMIRRILKNALPTTTNELFWSIGQSMYVAAFSRIGITAYAAYQAAASINSIFSFAAFSVGDATLIMVGEKIGEGESEETYKLGKKLLKIGTIVGVVCGLALMASAVPLVELFSLTTLGKSYAIRILIIYGAFMGLNLYNGINITGILRGGGDTKFAMFAELGCVWLVAVPLAFICSLWLRLPIYLVLLIMRIDDVIKMLILTKRFVSKKWLKNLIRGL